MAIIPAAPISMRDVVFDIDGSDFAPAVSAVTLTPTRPDTEARGLKPDAVYVFRGTDSWTLDGTVFYDDDDDSLFMWAWDHQDDDEPTEISIKPRSGGRAWVIQVFPAPLAVGGSEGSVASATFSWRIQGRPVPGVLA